MHSYNGKEVAIVIAGQDITGLGEDDFIAVEAEADDWSDFNGVDGETTRSAMNDRRATITLTLAASSPGNNLLDRLRKEDLRTGNGTFPVTIKDLRGDSEFSSEQTWVMKAPDRSFGREIGSVEWALRSAALTRTDGGNDIN